MPDSTNVARSLFAPIAVVLIATFVVASTAHADDATDHAEALFKAAVTALDAGDFATACPMFDESYKTIPALGTQLNLAICVDHAGKRVEALKQFRAVQAKARAADRKKTEADARAHAVALERDLARLRVHVAPSDSVSIDGEPAAPDPETGDEIVEPGEHLVEAMHDGHSAWRVRIAVAAGESKDVDVPVQRAIESPSRDESSSAMPWRTIGIGVAAAGLVGIGFGTGFGIAAQSNRDSALSACGSGGIQNCQASGVSSATSAWSGAKTDATLSTVGFVAGAVLLAGGAVLYFFAPTTAKKVGFAIEPGSTGIGGRW